MIQTYDINYDIDDINFKLCKQLYMSLHNTIGDNLLEYINNCPILVRGKMDEDMRRDTFYLINFQKSKEIIIAKKLSICMTIFTLFG